MADIEIWKNLIVYYMHVLLKNEIMDVDQVKTAIKTGK
jgi:hypothetical protein